MKVVVMILTLNIQSDYLRFNDIKHENLEEILKWYNDVDKFMFATGIDTPVTLETLNQKYSEVIICRDEFFVGIYSSKEENMVGVLKGRLQDKNNDSVWISSIVIDPCYQKTGIGSMSIDLLLGHLSENYDIKNAFLAVIEENIAGIAFWKKQNFCELRRIQNHLKLGDKKHNVIVMHRCLNSI